MECNNNMCHLMTYTWLEPTRHPLMLASIVVIHVREYGLQWTVRDLWNAIQPLKEWRRKNREDKWLSLRSHTVRPRRLRTAVLNDWYGLFNKIVSFAKKENCAAIDAPEKLHTTTCCARRYYKIRMEEQWTFEPSRFFIEQDSFASAGYSRVQCKLSVIVQLVLRR